MDSMEYLLADSVIGSELIYDLTESEFNSIRKSRDILDSAFDLEEKYDILLTNFLELEKEVLNIAVDHMIKRSLSDSFYSEQLRLNVRVVNILTSCRLYIDQSKRDVANCLEVNTSTQKIIKDIFAYEYDSNKHYRFVEALRNYVQHYGLPVHSIKFSSAWTSSIDDDGLMRNSLKISSLKRIFAKDKKLKSIVRQEILEETNLIESIRSYVESISEIHNKLRELITKQVKTHKEALKAFEELYIQNSKQKPISLVAVSRNKGKVTEKVYINIAYDDIYTQLQLANRKLTNLRKRYVTSEILQ